MAEKWYQVFDRRAEMFEDPLVISEYCWSGQPVSPEYIDERVAIITSEMKLEREHRLLEVGCGCNVLLGKLKERVGECYGIEPSEGMIRAGRRGRLLPVSCAEAAALPFAGAVFDRTLCYNVFAYLPDYEYAVAAMMEMARVTKSGGIIFIGEIQHAGAKEAYLKRRAESSTVYKPAHFDPRVRTELESRWYDPEFLSQRLEREGLRHEVAFPHPGGGFLADFRYSMKIYL